MFTRQDYIGYFESVEIQERTMIYRLYDFMHTLSEGYLKEALTEIANDEVIHYSFLKNLLNTALRAGHDQRRWQRENAFGTISITGAGEKNAHEMYIVDASEGGLCIEGQAALSVGARVDVRGETFTKDTRFNSPARIVWVRKILPEHYICGLDFEK
jgi:hypothetical protein